jgi:hypothetical protein
MSSKKDVNNEKPQGEDKKKISKTKKNPEQVDHTAASRWIQEELLKCIPELGYVSESLIERILKLEHKFYICRGYTAIRYASEEK